MLKPMDVEARNRRPDLTGGVTLNELARQSRDMGRVLRYLGAARGNYGLTADQVLIFMAIGHLGLNASTRTITLRPVSYVEASGLLAIPKETVRRKSQRLLDLDLLRMTTTGLVVTSPEAWLAMANELLSVERN